MAKKKENVDAAVYNPEETGAEKAQKIETVKVKLIANVKLNEDRYRLGEEIEVSQEDYEALLKVGVIDAE